MMTEKQIRQETNEHVISLMKINEVLKDTAIDIGDLTDEAVKAGLSPHFIKGAVASGALNVAIVAINNAIGVLQQNLASKLMQLRPDYNLDDHLLTPQDDYNGHETN